jgi:hypothetical protein
MRLTDEELRDIDENQIDAKWSQLPKALKYVGSHLLGG